jgi:hypothetical protein
MTVCAYDQERLAAWFGTGLDWMQLVSRCGFVYVARTPRAMSASPPRVLPAVGRDRHLSLPGAPWARPGASCASVMVRASPGVDAVAMGRSRTRFWEIIYLSQFLSFFRLTSGATGPLQNSTHRILQSKRLAKCTKPSVVLRYRRRLQLAAGPRPVHGPVASRRTVIVDRRNGTSVRP